MKKPKLIHTTREAWLQAAIEIFRPWFAEQGHEIPPTIYASVGFPRNDRNGLTIGQCWESAGSEDGGNHIFIHPKLTDLVQILGVVLHELAHAADDCQSGHLAPFVRIVRPLGLEGKPTETHVGDDLRVRLENEVLPALGAFPHAGLVVVSEAKKQGTRMIKVECPKDGYTLRTTRKWIAIGLPTCPCGTLMESDYNPDEGDDE